MKTHWSESYLGLPWERGARGPEKYDCWGLVRKIYEEQLGKQLATHNVDYYVASICANTLSSEFSKDCWEKLNKPVDMCVVAMSRSVRFFHHVGVYVELDGGLVLHSQEGANAVLQSFSELRDQCWRRFEFYGQSN